MSDPIHVKSTEKPTLFNKDAVLGGLAGLVTGSFFTGMVEVLTGVPVPMGIIGGAVGASVGGAVGKSRMHNELLHGKDVHKPSVFNKDTAIGALAGLALSGLAVLATVALGGGLTAAADLAQYGTIANTLAPATLFAAIGAIPASIGLGTFVGAMVGKKRMGEEYQQAQVQQGIEQQISRGQALSMAQAIERDPQLEQESTRSFVSRIEQERALQATQEQVR